MIRKLILQHKYRWKKPCAICSADKAERILVIIDRNDPKLAPVKKLCADYSASRKIRIDVCETNFSKEGSNLFGVPRKKMFLPVLMGPVRTIYVNLSKQDTFVYHFLNRCVPALYRLGVMPDSEFNITISGNDTLECAKMIFHLIDLSK